MKLNIYSAYFLSTTNERSVMKKVVYTFLTILFALLIFNEAALSQTLVDDWGLTPRGMGWPILNTASTPAGEAGLGGEPADPSNWSTIRGEFAPITISTGQTFVASGQLEYVGAGAANNYVGLRYALTFQDSTTLMYQYTDSARWVSTKGHYGYEFTPRSGNTDLANGSGGSGTVWTVINAAGWNSTYSNNGGPLPNSRIFQAPRNAQISAGKYDWAISVTALSDGSNEIRFYIQKQAVSGQQTTYWTGGTIIDTAQVTMMFNGVCFGIGNGLDPALTQFNLYAVQAGLGNPITVPDPPFEAFYVSNWGSLARHGWPIIKDSSTIIGNAGMGGTGSPPSGNWATLRGGWDDSPVKATLDTAIVITGKIQFIGGGPTSWSALRYGVFRHDSVGTLQYVNTDSARYSGKDNYAYGYMITPHSGTNDRVAGQGGNGTQWRVGGGSWVSTWSGGTMTLGDNNQAPARALFSAGTYNFAFSVQPLADGSNELRFYIIKEDNSYWFAGTVIDEEGITTTFNGIIFGINNGNDIGTTGLTEVQVSDVKVDLGLPIEIPEAPWAPYYLDAWGFIGGRTGGWDFMPGAIIGNAGAGGTEPNSDWVAVRGGLITPVDISSGRKIIFSGKLKFEGGGFEGWSGLRYGLFYGENPGTVVDGDTITAHWTGSEDAHSGYIFMPPSGTNALPIWAGVGTSGSWGGVLNDVWLYTSAPNNYILGSDVQTPANAVAVAGTYDFQISVERLTTGNKVTFSLVKDDGSYSFTGSKLDAHNVLVTEKFNGIYFALNSWSGSTTTAMKIEDVLVDRSDIVGVEDENNGTPIVFSLMQNYPNPFNPATTIEFALPQTSNVNLVVYDLLGRVVRELASGEFNAGYHKINFDASNLASGIYFYSLKAGDFVSVKKLMLLK